MKIIGKNFNVRKKVGVATLMCMLSLFLLTTPISSWAIDFIKAPSEVENVEIIRTSSQVQISWDKAIDTDIKSYIIKLNDSEVEVGKDIDTYTFKEIASDIEVNIEIGAKDITGRVSKISHSLEKLSGVGETAFLNNHTLDTNKATEIIIRVAAMSLVILGFSLWILHLEAASVKHITIALYPMVILVPYFLITLSFLYSETEAFSKFLLSFIFACVFGFVSYLLFLTMNILNASLRVELPLEQAAKAAQFVFSLISSYLIMILFFGGNYSILDKLIIIVPFILYFTFSSLIMLKGTSLNQIIFRTASITLTMIFAILILSMWPVNYVFAMISSAVVFYALLSIALEVRYKVTKYIWTEYTVLLILIVILLMTNSSWGIKGSLI